jgi:hypothetical protein
VVSAPMIRVATTAGVGISGRAGTGTSAGSGIGVLTGVRAGAGASLGDAAGIGVVGLGGRGMGRPVQPDGLERDGPVRHGVLHLAQAGPARTTGCGRRPTGWQVAKSLA